MRQIAEGKCNVLKYVFFQIVVYLYLIIHFKRYLSIAVNIQSDHMKVIDMKKKIGKANSQKEIAQLTSYKVRQKAEDLKSKMRKDVQMSHEDYVTIMSEVHEYEVSLKDVGKEMKNSQKTFLEVHGATLQVLNVAGEIEISDERFNIKGQRKFECMFCSKRFDNTSLAEISHTYVLLERLDKQGKKICKYLINIKSVINFVINYVIL